MDDNQHQAEQFEEHRPQLRAVAYRMLGSLERGRRRRPGGVAAAQPLRRRRGREPGRLADDRRRAHVPGHAARAPRTARGLVGSWLPEPIVSAGRDADPEHQAVLADSVGLALLVVLDTLSPRRAARLRPARHVRRAVRGDRPDRRPHARRRAPARQPRAPARARRGADARSRPGRQREVVDAFLAAARAGDFDALLEVLDPDVVFRVDAGRGPHARPPAVGARGGGARAAVARPALRAARPAGDRQRRRGVRPGARRAACRGRRLHRGGRPHRRDRPHRRSREAARALRD